MWGISVHIDLFGCDVTTITDPLKLAVFSRKLVEVLGMEAYGDPQIQWFGNGDTEGFTLVQLLTTSCITAHFSEKYKRSAYIDIFSCKEYDPEKVVRFCGDFFRATIYHSTGIIRGDKRPTPIS